MGYGVQIVWSELGYAAICSGAFSMLARQIWLSSKWVYMVDCSPLLIVVSLEREIIGALKIRRDQYQT